MAFKTTYRKVKLLGEGAFGAAYLVERRDDPKALLVCKEVRITHLTQKEKDSALEEATLLKQISHSNIVAYEESFIEINKLYIVMEYADDGDLGMKVRDRKEEKRAFSERRVMLIFVQVAEALQYIHARKILHRDLKPMNIFLTKEGVVKLGDFGIARVLESSTAGAQTTIGTPFYLSPEQCNNEPYGLKSDLWSLGVVTYELAALKVPFHAPSLPAVAMMICGADPEPLPRTFSRGLVWIVNQLLLKDPAERPKLSEILAVPFVQEYLNYLRQQRRGEQQTPDEGNFRQDILDTRDTRDRHRGGRLEVPSNAVQRRGSDSPSENKQRRGGASENPSEYQQRGGSASENASEYQQRVQQSVKQEFLLNRKVREETRRRANEDRSGHEDYAPSSSPRPDHEEERQEYRGEFRRSEREERLASERAALECAHREAAQDRLLAQQRRKRAALEESAALETADSERAPSPHHGPPGRAYSEDGYHEHDVAQRVDKRPTRSAWQPDADVERSCSPEVEDDGAWRRKRPEDVEAQNRLQELERARREAAEETRRLHDKYVQVRKGSIGSAESADWLPSDPDRKDSGPERDFEDQSTTAPTESDAATSEVLVVDMRAPGAGSRNRGSTWSSGSPLGSTPSAPSRQPHPARPERAGRSERDSRTPPPQERPAPVRQKEAASKPLTMVTPRSTEASDGREAADADAREARASWRPELWPDANTEGASAPEPSSEHRRPVDRPNESPTSISSAPGSRTPKAKPKALDARRPGFGSIIDPKEQVLEERRRLNEEKRQEFFRNKKALQASKKKADGPQDQKSHQAWEPKIEFVGVSPETTEGSTFIASRSMTDEGWYVIQQAAEEARASSDSPSSPEVITRSKSTPSYPSASADPVPKCRPHRAATWHENRDVHGEAHSMCPRGHTLESYVRRFPGSNLCDPCKREIDPPERLYRCEQCDFDMCLECYAVCEGDQSILDDVLASTDDPCRQSWPNRRANSKGTVEDEEKSVSRQLSKELSDSGEGPTFSGAQVSAELEPVRNGGAKSSRFGSLARGNPLFGNRKVPQSPAENMTVTQRAREIAGELFSPAHRADAKSPAAHRPNATSRQSPAAAGAFPSGVPPLPCPNEQAEATADERAAYADLPRQLLRRPKEMNDVLRAVCASIQVVNADEAEGHHDDSVDNDPAAAMHSAAEDIRRDSCLSQEGIYEASHALDQDLNRSDLNGSIQVMDVEDVEDSNAWGMQEEGEEEEEYCHEEEEAEEESLLTQSEMTSPLPSPLQNPPDSPDDCHPFESF